MSEITFTVKLHLMTANAVAAKAVRKIPRHLGLSHPRAYAYFSNILFDLYT